MHGSREIAGGNREILELRTGEKTTAHRQMKTHRKALISAGGEKNIQKQLQLTVLFPLSENESQCCGPVCLVSQCVTFCVIDKNCRHRSLHFQLWFVKEGGRRQELKF